MSELNVHDQDGALVSNIDRLGEALLSEVVDRVRNMTSEKLTAFVQSINKTLDCLYLVRGCAGAVMRDRIAAQYPGGGSRAAVSQAMSEIAAEWGISPITLSDDIAMYEVWRYHTESVPEALIESGAEPLTQDECPPRWVLQEVSCLKDRSVQRRMIDQCMAKMGGRGFGREQLRQDVRAYRAQQSAMAERSAPSDPAPAPPCFPPPVQALPAPKPSMVDAFFETTAPVSMEQLEAGAVAVTVHIPVDELDNLTRIARARNCTLADLVQALALCRGVVGIDADHIEKLLQMQIEARRKGDSALTLSDVLHNVIDGSSSAAPVSEPFLRSCRAQLDHYGSRIGVWEYVKWLILRREALIAEKNAEFARIVSKAGNSNGLPVEKDATIS